MTTTTCAGVSCSTVDFCYDVTPNEVQVERARSNTYCEDGFASIVSKYILRVVACNDGAMANTLPSPSPCRRLPKGLQRVVAILTHPRPSWTRRESDRHPDARLPPPGPQRWDAPSEGFNERLSTQRPRATCSITRNFWHVLYPVACCTPGT